MTYVLRRPCQRHASQKERKDYFFHICFVISDELSTAKIQTLRRKIDDFTLFFIPAPTNWQKPPPANPSNLLIFKRASLPQKRVIFRKNN
jgi:hypothetical protein